MASLSPRSRVARWSLASAAAAALALVPTLSAAASPAHPAVKQSSTLSAEQQRETANEKLIIYLNDQLFNHGNVAIIPKYFGPSYIQHNPTVANGDAALAALVTNVRKLFPHLASTSVRVVAQGDLVFLENHVVSVPGTAGSATFDIYRVVNGHVVEHWDILQSEPATTVSGNNMLSALTGPATDAPPPVTQDDEDIVLNYLTQLTQEHQLSVIDQYVAPNLYQHDPTIADGSAALEQYYAALFAKYPNYGIQIDQVVAQGDLVAVHAHLRDEPNELGQSVVYLFKVEHGQIVEQWDSVQDVPATDANDNTMF